MPRVISCDGAFWNAELTGQRTAALGQDTWIEIVRFTSRASGESREGAVAMTRGDLHGVPDKRLCDVLRAAKIAVGNTTASKVGADVVRSVR
jgi:hypothetical protein